MMLVLVEGTIHRPLSETEGSAVEAWLGPMVDSGFLQSGYIDTASRRLWMLLTGEHLDDVQTRLNDLPVVRDGSCSFTAVPVRALRFD
jgi:hypothetical protein